MYASVNLEDGAKPIRQPQRRLNPVILDVVKEVTKLLQAGIIYPISDSQWVSLVQVVPKKTSLTVIKKTRRRSRFLLGCKIVGESASTIGG